ncbi:hypothetical protein [Paenibacillus illinoisensis]|uniref:hypothetical protein n=1 Tax=Paenibacillus illinoisensis TaxID=59845 RepID=UPI00301B83C0
MPDPFLRNFGSPIYVDHISWLTVEDHLYTLDWPTPDDYFYVSPHIYMEDHYFGRVGTLTRSLMSDEKRLTAGDLALAVIGQLPTKGTWDMLILSQTCPERHALTAPLARMLETAPWQVLYPLALSHMGSLAATESIQAAQWSLHQKDEAAIVLVEQRVLHEDHPSGYRGRTENEGEIADMAVALKAGLREGALQVHYAGKRIMGQDEAGTFSSEVLEMVDEMMNGFEAEHIILQSRLGMRISRNSIVQLGSSKTVCVPQTDYQSGDIWIQLADKLQRGIILPNDRVLMLSWDGDRMISACCVLVIHLPELSKLTLNLEIKTP